MYSKTYGFMTIILILCVSLTTAQPKQANFDGSSTEDGSFHDDKKWTELSEVRIIKDISPISLLVLKAHSKGMQWIQFLLDNSGPLEEFEAIKSLKNTLHTLNHKHSMTMDEFMIMVDSKPKTTHSCQNLIV